MGQVRVRIVRRASVVAHREVGLRFEACPVARRLRMIRCAGQSRGMHRRS